VQDPPGAGGAAASASAAAIASDTMFDLVCPICLTTELKLRNSVGRPSGDLHCPRCSRTFGEAPPPVS
jgi:hypothetical protein